MNRHEYFEKYRPEWFSRWMANPCPSWWPWPNLCANRVGFWALFIGFLLGTAISWWLNYVPPPWLEINTVKAVYERGTEVITITGQYTARKTCSRAERKTPPGDPNPLVWRQEVTGTGPEIILFAPKPAPPELALGVHRFTTLIPLARGISPDGWQVALLVSCDREPVAVRTISVPVQFVAPGEADGPP